MQKLKIVFMGTPDFAVGSLKALVDDGQNVVGVITAPDKASGRGQKIQSSPVKLFAQQAGIVNILQPTNLKDPNFLEELKKLENEGYEFEGADASFEILVKKSTGNYNKHFELIGARTITEKRQENDDSIAEATVIVNVDGITEHTAAIGNGPVNALDNSLRKALEKFYPKLKDVQLIDYRVRVVTRKHGTDSVVRVLIESGDGDTTWSTVGVSENIVEASWKALVDSIEYKLMKDDEKRARKARG